MGWNKVTKEELKEAGLDVDAFTAALQKTGQIDELNTKFGELKTAVDGLASIKDTLAGLEAKITTPKPPEKTNNNSGDEGNQNQDDDVDFVLEPEKATRSVVSKMVTPLIATTADMRIQLNIANFKATNPVGFKKYETEIMEMFNKEPVGNKVNPSLIENCYKIVIANHMDDIRKGGESFFVETGGSSSGNQTGDVKKKAVDVLNKDQLDLCTKWGVDPEDYLKELQGGGVTTYA